MAYNQAVRRFVAIVIVVLIGLPAFSPLFALSSSSDFGRPACCRRDGKHRCMLMDMDRDVSLSRGDAAENQAGRRLAPASVSERCPYGSKTLPGANRPDWTLGTAAAIFAGVVAHPSSSPQTESKRRIAADRSRQKRGPPQNS